LKDSAADELVEVQDNEEVRSLLGPLDSNSRLIRDLYGVNVLLRDGGIRLLGKLESVQQVREILVSSLEDHRAGTEVNTAEFARRLRAQSPVALPEPGESPRVERSPGPVRPRTPGQEKLWTAMQENDLVFSVGPAGTGKTYLAVAAAVESVKSGESRRIVLVRPAVEAGEKLGFLPGDFQAKINPYLRPLYDALHDMLEPNARQRYMESDVIEVCPLAYMRGRTLNNSFIILDEAQNCTVPQMLMFLTRMGQGSRMVVNGDPSQVDLPKDQRSGLSDAVNRLKAIDGLAIVQLGDRDIVRHAVVQRIVNAYGKRR
jgi:phosphate starvation-inducible PhoH-like protein